MHLTSQIKGYKYYQIHIPALVTGKTNRYSQISLAPVAALDLEGMYLTTMTCIPHAAPINMRGKNILRSTLKRNKHVSETLSVNTGLSKYLQNL